MTRRSDIETSQRVRVMDIADWCKVRVEVSNMDGLTTETQELTQAVRTLVNSQQELLAHEQELVAQLERGGVLRQLARRAERVWQRLTGRVRT